MARTEGRLPSVLPPNPRLAAALRQVKVPKNMTNGKALVAHVLDTADNGLSDSKCLSNTDTLLSLVALSQIEVLATIGENEAKLQAVKDWIRPPKAG